MIKLNRSKIEIWSGLINFEVPEKIMKIMLFTLNASYVHKSLALRCLNNSLKNKGYDTVFAEYTTKENRLSVLKRLVEENADIYSFSCYIWNISEMLVLSEKLKKILPESTIILGGPEVSYESEEFFKEHNYIDFIISGEGEESLPELCESISQNGRENLKSKFRIVKSKPFKDFKNSGVVYDAGDNITSSIVYYESSRGCPYSCSYCLSASEIGLRYKEEEQVLEELLEIQKLNMNVKIIKFVDRTFNFDKRRAIKIWSALLSDKYLLKYHFEICAELIDDECIEVLSKFPKGKIQLEAGVQSTNINTLNAINRRGDVNKCIDNIKKLKRLGNIHIHADLIAGLPLENFESFSRSFDKVYCACDMLQLGFLKILKGSPLSYETDKYGIVYSDNPPYEVLKTDYMSFNDLVKLHSISDTLDRTANSGHFNYLLSYVMEKVNSPFSFYLSLSEYLGNITSLSQLKLIELLYSFVVSISSIDREEATGRLRLDYYINEAGSCPSFLHGGGEQSVAPIYKSLLTKKADAKKSAVGLEVHRFSFDLTGYYLIDRKNHTCERYDEKEILC